MTMRAFVRAPRSAVSGVRCFSAEMDAYDHAEAHDPYHVLLNAFFKYKLLGDKLGFAWQVGERFFFFFILIFLILSRRLM